MSAALDEDLLLGVDHDFRDLGVIEHLGKHIETTEAVEDSIAQIELVPEAELRMGEEELVDAVIQLRIAEAPLLLESGEQLLLQFLLQFSLIHDCIHTLYFLCLTESCDPLPFYRTVYAVRSACMFAEYSDTHACWRTARCGSAS